MIWTFLHLLNEPEVYAVNLKRRPDGWYEVASVVELQEQGVRVRG